MNSDDNKALKALERKCKHPDEHVEPIAAKEYPGGYVLWCNLCGAWRDDDEWKWHIPADPKKVFPADFLDDALAFSRMFHTGGVACDVAGLEFQEDMMQRWPKEWMELLFVLVGKFEGKQL